MANTFKKSKKILEAKKNDPRMAAQLKKTATFVNFFTINALIANAKKGSKTMGATVLIV